MTPTTWIQLLCGVVVVVVLVVLKSPAALHDAHQDRSPVSVRVQAARPTWVKPPQDSVLGDLREHQRTSASVATLSERPSWPGSPIPAHIHQMWIDDKPPCGYDNGVPRWVIANPNFSHTLWTHATSDRFVRVEYGDDTWRVYDLLYAGAYRADLFRYMLLYKRGGWWSDIDHGPYLRGMRGEPTIPLDQMAAIDGGVPPDTSLIIPRNIGFRWMVENHLIGAASGNPVLKLAIDTVLSNLRDHKIPAGHAHFAMTGPELFGNCINRCIDPKKTADMVPIKTGLPLGPGRCMNSTFFIMLTNWSGNFVSEHGPKVARRYQCEGRKKHPLLVPYGPRTIFRPENVTRTKIK